MSRRQLRTMTHPVVPKATPPSPAGWCCSRRGQAGASRVPNLGFPISNRVPRSLAEQPAIRCRTSPTGLRKPAQAAVDRLSGQRHQVVLDIAPRSLLRQKLTRHLRQPELLVQLAVRQQSGVGSDLAAHGSSRTRASNSRLNCSCWLSPMGSLRRSPLRCPLRPVRSQLLAVRTQNLPGDMGDAGQRMSSDRSARRVDGNASRPTAP